MTRDPNTVTLTLDLTFPESTPQGKRDKIVKQMILQLDQAFRRTGGYKLEAQAEAEKDEDK